MKKSADELEKTSSDLAMSCDGAGEKREKKRPKATYVGLDVLKIGTSSAIIGSNEGTSGI